MQISILNQIFNIQAQGCDDPAYMEQLAAYVEEKMKDVQHVTNTIDSYRLALLAAFHIADDLFQMQDQYEQLDHFMNRKSTEFVKILEQFTE